MNRLGTTALVLCLALLGPAIASARRAGGADTLYTRGRRQFKAGNYKGAVRSWGRLLRSYEDNLSKRRQARIWVLTATAYAKLERYDKAFRCIRRARRLYPASGKLARLEKTYAERIGSEGPGDPGPKVTPPTPPRGEPPPAELVAPKPERLLSLGSSVRVAVRNVGPKGGKVLVWKPGDPLDGFTIKIPQYAFDDGVTVYVSYRPVVDHRRTGGFLPVTPLIRVVLEGPKPKKALEIFVPLPRRGRGKGRAYVYDEKKDHAAGIAIAGNAGSHLQFSTKDLDNPVFIALWPGRPPVTLDDEL